MSKFSTQGMSTLELIAALCSADDLQFQILRTTYKPLPDYMQPDNDDTGPFSRGVRTSNEIEHQEWVYTSRSSVFAETEKARELRGNMDTTKPLPPTTSTFRVKPRLTELLVCRTTIAEIYHDVYMSVYNSTNSTAEAEQEATAVVQQALKLGREQVATTLNSSKV